MWEWNGTQLMMLGHRECERGGKNGAKECRVVTKVHLECEKDLLLRAWEDV